MISILLHTMDYRGDHSTDVVLAIAEIPGETVEQLVGRTIGKNKYVNGASEHIEIRIAHEEQKK